MIKKFFLISYILGSVIFLIYLFLPAPTFPNPPFDSVQSLEEADTETPLKKAYFTNFTREQVIDHYLNQFNRHSLRLNYPPEDAQTLIRDQTRSVYLEELAHPLRESLFINGFEPRQPKDDIWYKGVHYQAKITIKYYSSPVVTRVLIAIPTIGVGWILINMWVTTLVDIIKVIPWKKK
jgi:hypothetical protein